MANKKIPQVLKRSSDFELIKRSGKKTHPTRWMTLAYKPNQLGILRYGFTISRKVGSAVIRNRLKRWGRIEFKKLGSAHTELEVDINVIFRPMESNFYKELEQTDFQKALGRGIRFVQ